MIMTSCCYIPVSLAMVEPAASWTGTMRGIHVHLLDNLPNSPEKENGCNAYIGEYNPEGLL
jgi:hypothetical protein